MFDVTVLEIIIGLIVYFFFAVCFAVCYVRALPKNSKVNEMLPMFFWPFYLVAMTTCCIFGCLNRLYRWLDKED